MHIRRANLLATAHDAHPVIPTFLFFLFSREVKMIDKGEVVQ